MIYMEDALKKTDTQGFPEGVQFHAFCDVLTHGDQSKFGKTQNGNSY
jgi:hypothetical protein